MGRLNNQFTFQLISVKVYTFVLTWRTYRKRSFNGLLCEVVLATYLILSPSTTPELFTLKTCNSCYFSLTLYRWCNVWVSFVLFLLSLDVSKDQNKTKTSRRPCLSSSQSIFFIELIFVPFVLYSYSISFNHPNFCFLLFY